MENLEITKENAVKAYNEGNGKQKELLINLFGAKTFQLKVTDRIKTIHDVAAELGKPFYEHSNDTKDEKAYRKLKGLAKILNEGWEPNWKNTSEAKWSVYYVFNNSGFSLVACHGWFASCYVGSRLCFKSRELAEFAYTNFKELFDDYLL